MTPPRWKCKKCSRISYGWAKGAPCPYCGAPATELIELKDEEDKEEKQEKKATV